MNTKELETKEDEITKESTEPAAEKAEGGNAVSLPEHPLYEVDVHMNTSVLYDYMLRHTYTSPLGLVATLLGFLALLFFLKGAGGLYLVIGIVMIVYLPWNLFLTARKQAITNEAFQRPLHYTFAEEGVYVSQGETVQMQAWKDMYKAISTPRSIVLYTSKVNASVFPRADLGDDTALVIELISTHMPPKKVRIRQ